MANGTTSSYLKATYVSNDINVMVTLGAGSDYSYTISYESPAIDITRFKRLNISGTSYKTTGNTQPHYSPRLYLVNLDTNTTTLLFQQNNSVVSQVIDIVDYDISSLVGEYALRIEIGGYGQGDAGAYLKLVTADFLAT